MAKTNRRKPPSRVRYEQSHPTISCRVPRDIYDRLQAVKKKGSFAEILKVGMGLIEAKDKELIELAKQYVEKAHNKGYTEAEGLYRVDYPCSVCGETISITTDAEKKVVSKYMQEQYWRHGECKTEKRQDRAEPT